MSDSNVNKATENKAMVRDLVSAGACLALCLGLPFLTGQIPQIGNALCPMHIPVLLAGFLCGPWWAMLVGISAPLLRFALFGMPPLFPVGAAMSFELAAYGLVAGLLYRRLPRNNASIYVALLTAMLAGRVVWGVVMMGLMGISGGTFTWAAFVAGAFVNAVPGIIVHIILIPVLVMALRKAGFAR